MRADKQIEIGQTGSLRPLFHDREYAPGENHHMTGQTLAQKILARASGQSEVNPGDIVTCEVDLAMFHDSSGPRRLQPMLDSLGATVWDTDRIVLVIDHYLSAPDRESQQIVQIAREWADKMKLKNFYDSQGICHVVLPERGHLRPGMFCVGGDSHSPTGGAFGTYMFGIGATEMLGVVVTGEIWVRVPRTIRYQFDGQLDRGVSAKDLMLTLIGRYGMDGGQYQAVEFAGSTVSAMDMPERMTLSNMAAELGAQAGLVQADETTRQYLLKAGVPDSAIDLSAGQGDAGADVELHRFDATLIEPQIALPHSPANSVAASQCEPSPVDIAYLGACTGAKLVDMQAAAAVLRGKKIASSVAFLLAPASVRDQEAARVDGSLQILIDAGAHLLPSACGACAGYGSRISEGARVISSTARNFQGRMGAASAQVWLGSPYTVAASAVRGRLTDPRELL